MLYKGVPQLIPDKSKYFHDRISANEVWDWLIGHLHL